MTRNDRRISNYLYDNNYMEESSFRMAGHLSIRCFDKDDKFVDECFVLVFEPGASSRLIHLPKGIVLSYIEGGEGEED